MYFILSKVLWFVAGPINVLVVVAALGAIVLFTRFARAGRTLVVLAAAGLLVAGYSPLSNALILPLEQQFPPYRDDGGPVAGIIVLGGPVEQRPSIARGQLMLNDSAERIIAMADLARRMPGARVVFTGGSSALTGQGDSEADTLERHIGSLGLAPDRVLYERASRNTDENARFTRNLLQPGPGERFILVTSAFHMPRSVGLFRAAGFEVVAYPVDFRTAGPQDLFRIFVSASDGLRRCDLALREWVGLIVARLVGQTGNLLPGP